MFSNIISNEQAIIALVGILVAFGPFVIIDDIKDAFKFYKARFAK